MSSDKVEQAVDQLLGVPLKKEVTEEGLENFASFVPDNPREEDLGDFNGDELLRAVWEGGIGYRDLPALFSLLNPEYRDVDDFLEDNPGCLDAIVLWVGEQIDKDKDWRIRIEDAVREQGGID